MKFLWWTGLVLAIIGILLYLDIFSINLQVKFLTGFWVEVVAAALLAISALGKK